MSPVRRAVPPIPSSPRARIAFSMFSCPCRSCEWQCTNNLSASLPATLAALVVPSRLSRLVSRPRLAREERTRPKRHDFFVQHRLLLRSFFGSGFIKATTAGFFPFNGYSYCSVEGSFRQRCFWSIDALVAGVVRRYSTFVGGRLVDQKLPHTHTSFLPCGYDG